MKKVIIFGAGNFGDMAHYYFVHDSDYEVVAFTADDSSIKETTCRGLPVVPFSALPSKFSADKHDIFVAVGVTNNNQIRADRCEEVISKGYNLANFLSSKATVPSDFLLQPNSWIMENVHIHPYVEIGRNTVIQSGSNIGFKSKIGESCWISSGLCGEQVVVGNNTFIGLDASISSFISVGKNNIIGAGALILKDTKDFEVYRGTASSPSRVPSTRFSQFNGLPK